MSDTCLLMSLLAHGKEAVIHVVLIASHDCIVFGEVLPDVCESFDPFTYSVLPNTAGA